MSLISNRLQAALETIIDRSQHCSAPYRNMYSHLSATCHILSYVAKRNAAWYIITRPGKKPKTRLSPSTSSLLSEYQIRAHRKCNESMHGLHARRAYSTRNRNPTGVPRRPHTFHNNHPPVLAGSYNMIQCSGAFPYQVAVA